MAQERNEINASTSETNEIQREIERTRVEMSETIGQIQDRLRPDHLLQQAKDGVKDAATGKVKDIMNSAGETAYEAAQQARGAGNHLVWYAKEHPLRIAITAGVITWWLLRNKNNNELDYYGSSDTSWDQDEYGSTDSGMRGKVGGYASSARETVGEYASTARETVGEYAATARDTVNEYAASAASTAKGATRKVRTAASTATTVTNDWMQDNPLAAGILAVAVGAAIGLAAPATDYEDRAIGETRDQALEKAKTAVNALKQNVGEKVAAYAETVVDESMKNMNAATEPPMGQV
ncbi:MAG TPA: DUF3618 domain-containing protein [Vicinamibacterales bacterium]|nr:DUF3618 domain-containing protein [Vicinamibacterales bacterium]